MRDDRSKIDKTMEKFVIEVIIGCFIATCISACISAGAIRFSKRENQSSIEDRLPRFETIEEGQLDKNYLYYKVVVDRETDVEYLIINRGDNISVSLMRDSGGMVLLRE